MNVRENRPEVQEASLRIADYYQQHGIAGPELAQMTSTVLGSFVRSEAVAQGIQRGLQFLSLLVAGIGLAGGCTASAVFEVRSSRRATRDHS